GFDGEGDRERGDERPPAAAEPIVVAGAAARSPHAGHAVAGRSSCCGRSSAISNQDAFEPTKMWRSGRMPGSSSSAPMGTRAIFRAWSNQGSFEPQRRQKTLKKKRDSGGL